MWDPLSLYLFFLCMEKLALLIAKKVSDGSCCLVKVLRGGPAISYLFFVDNCLHFVKAKASHVQLVSKVLEDFCLASRLKANLDKSRFIASKNISRAKIAKFSGITSMTHTTSLGKYLGFLRA